MMTRLSSQFAILGLASLLLACLDGGWPTEMDIPSELEALALTTDQRPGQPGEALPAVSVSLVEGGIRVRVARPALCAMLASAGIRRTAPINTAGQIVVFAAVSPNPAALCTADAGGVSEYEGVIPAGASGFYNVFVYEALGDSRARDIGGGAVRIR